MPVKLFNKEIGVSEMGWLEVEGNMWWSLQLLS